MATMTKRRREPTEAQKLAAQERRGRMRKLAERISGMPDDERLALAMRAGIRTVEGRELSPFNQCMVIMQHDGASVVGGFRQWRVAGRHVRKGERGLAIWFPIAKGEQSEGAPELAGEERGGPRFALATVFDISQTDAIDHEQAQPEALPSSHDLQERGIQKARQWATVGMHAY